jgi:myo-inositol-1(or 4)-monophosphatase
LEIVVNIAQEAGQLIKEGASKEFNVSYKGPVDLVTSVDLASQRLIKKRLASAFPTHQIIAEESGNVAATKQYAWIVDPLDGTTNFAHKFPIFSVSIALKTNNQIVLGVVHEINFAETFWAIKGEGAWLNGKKIKTSQINDLDKALLATGFPYNLRNNYQPVMKLFSSFALKTQGIRRAGAATIDLCYVACGRLDGFWELGLKPWDMAAGSLIVEEAGGKVSRFDGSPLNLWHPEIVASNNILHQQMLEIISQAK